MGPSRALRPDGLEEGDLPRRQWLRPGQRMAPLRGGQAVMTTETDVLIVGAGPAGLVAATTLARYGIAATVVDRRLVPNDHPRATVVSTWSMELMRSWGIEDEIRAGAVDVEWRGLL